LAYRFKLKFLSKSDTKGACKRSNETELGRYNPILIPYESTLFASYLEFRLSDSDSYFLFCHPDRNGSLRAPKASLGTALEASFRRANRRKWLFFRPFSCLPLGSGGKLRPSDAFSNDRLLKFIVIEILPIDHIMGDMIASQQ